MTVTEITKDELQGFRAANNTEVKHIQKLLLPEVKQTQKVLTILTATFIFLTITMFLAGITKLPSDGFVELIISAISLILTAVSARQKAITDEFRRKIERHRFKVLECWPYKIDLNGDNVHTVDIWVYTLQGQTCTDKFVINRTAIRTYQKEHNNTPLLLMKCRLGRFGENRYAIFTEEGLEDSSKIIPFQKGKISCHKH